MTSKFVQGFKQDGRIWQTTRDRETTDHVTEKCVAICGVA